MQPAVIEFLRLWLPVHEPLDLRFRQRWENDLRLLQLANTWMSTARAAFPIGAGAPMQIGIDGADSSVASRFLEARFPHAEDNIFQIILRG